MRMCTRSCADDKGLVGREICEYAFVKQALLKLVQTFAQQCFRSIPQNDQSPVTRTEFEGAGRRFSEEIDQKGRLKMTEPAACVCVCVFAVNPIFILLFSRLNPCVNPNIYKQYVFQTKLPGLFGVNFLFLFHQRMWTSFCLVIWYPLVMIFFKVDLNILLFACEASWNLWKPLCFWCDIPTLTPWLRITVIWYCYTVDIPLRSSSWLSGSC